MTSRANSSLRGCPKHNPKITLPQADTVAIAEYIHSILATSGGQGSPPGRNPTNVNLNVLVGDAAAGQSAFQTLCSSCHSVTGDLKGIGSKFTDPRQLQNAWVGGSADSSPFGGGFGRGGNAPQPATLTFADGTTLQATLVREDDFMAVVTLADGSRRAISKVNGFPKIVTKDPQEAHKAMVLKLDDPDNKKMHDITAYLATIK